MDDEPSKEQLEYEARVQRRLQVLKQRVDAGQVKLLKGSNAVASLERVRYAPDGRVDLSTVDGVVRSMALAVEAIHDREEMKQAASLAEIQATYFDFLETNFGRLYKEMVERGATPHRAGLAFSRTPDTVATVLRNLTEFLGALEEFWSSAGRVAIAHVEDMSNCLKGVFGGDLFPSSAENIASRCGLYTDTLVLPDPYLRSKHVFERFDDEQKAYYLIKHGLNLLQYRELACADVSPPIVVVLPDISAMDEDEKRHFYRLGQDDAVKHSERVFGRQFSSFDELMEFCGHLDTVERAAAEVKDASRVLFNTEWQGTLHEQLERATTDSMYSRHMGATTPGHVLAAQALGRMGTSNELLVKAYRLKGTPILDAPTSWQYLVWKMEYDAKLVEGSKGLKDLHTVRGLQTLAENEMRWLGRVPPASLIEIRKTGALGEIRNILSQGIEDLANANAANFHRTSDRVFDNIQSAFSEHQRSIDALVAKKWRFAGSDLGSWLVVGSLAVTAVATGALIWGVAAFAADQVLPAPKLRDLPKKAKELASESRQLKRSPVGMLFKLSKNEESGQS